MSTPTETTSRETLRTVQFSIPGMDCPSCATTVTNALETVEGHSTIDPRPTSGTLRVTYDPEHATERELTDAIEGAGYDVTETTADESNTGTVSVAESTDIWTSPRAVKTWVGAGFLALGLLVEFVLTGQNAPLGSVLGREFVVSDGFMILAILVAGLPVIRSGYRSVRNRSLDIDVLMAVAILAAAGVANKYLTDAAVLAVLFNVAELLESYAMDRARDSLRELMELSPNRATVRRDGDERTVPTDEVRVGETVLVYPGEKIPVDGVVIEGTGAVNQAPITGESVPVDKSTKDRENEVYAGTISDDGYFEIEATSEASETTLSRIIEMVEDAQTNKTESEKFVDRFAGYYTPAVVVLAVLTATIPPLVFAGAWETWFIRGLTLLVIGCPCAFVISTPVSVVSGITSAAKNGVLIKGGNHLEAMGRIDAIAFDKTGTLTTGELSVTDVLALDDATETDVLRVARGVEERSDHPIAAAIVAYAADAGVSTPGVENFESLTGKGVRADLDGSTYYAGNPNLFAERADEPDHAHLTSDGGVTTEQVPQKERPTGENSLEGTVSDLQEDGKTVVVVGTEETIVGVIAVADELRAGAREAIGELHELGVERTVMLTGDNEGTARAIAEGAGIEEYRADLLPEGKVEEIDALLDEHERVAMVGDGVNDAPALATATVGVAMGAAGTDTALETADIALMSDALSRLPYLRALAGKANGVIRENIGISLGMKALLALGVPLGVVNVAVAVVVGDMGMSLGVTGNAMRLSRVDPNRFLDE